MDKKRRPKQRTGGRQETIKADVKIEPRADTPFYYANYMAVTHTPYDFTISIARMPSQPSPEQMAAIVKGQSLLLEPTLQIILPPRVAKGLIHALEDQCGSTKSNLVSYLARVKRMPSKTNDSKPGGTSIIGGPSPSADFAYTSASTATSESFSVGPSWGVVYSVPTKSGGPSNVENAVYAHVRAVRALGRTKIDSSEIAAALGLSVEDVNKALKALQRKGVRIL